MKLSFLALAGLLSVAVQAQNFVKDNYTKLDKQVTMRDGVKPVSYTHLDVYKRQPL